MWQQSNPRSISVAEPITLHEKGAYDFRTLGLQSGVRDGLYVVRKPQEYLTWELIYASRTPGFKDITYSAFELREETEVSSNKAAYLALPLTIPLDVATFPFQMMYKAAKGY